VGWRHRLASVSGAAAVSMARPAYTVRLLATVGRRHTVDLQVDAFARHLGMGGRESSTDVVHDWGQFGRHHDLERQVTGAAGRAGGDDTYRYSA